MSASSPGRPIGITILAVLAAIGGFFEILAGLSLLGIGGLGFFGGATVEGGAVSVVGLIALLIGIVSVLLAWGFWTLKPWAWMIGVALYVIQVIQVIAGYFLVEGTSIVSVLIGLIIPGIILYYLMSANVRAAFGR